VRHEADHAEGLAVRTNMTIIHCHLLTVCCTHQQQYGWRVYHITEALRTKTKLHTAQHISQSDKKHEPFTYSIYFTIYSLVNDTFNMSKLYSFLWYNNWWIRNQKGWQKKYPWPNLMYYSSMYLKEEWRTTKKTSVSLAHLWARMYKEEMLTTQLLCSVQPCRTDCSGCWYHVVVQNGNDNSE
jgi:hypothetical protein